MAEFTQFLDILPSPTNPIGDAGQALAVGSGGKAGPGYASVKVDGEYKTTIDQTNSGRLVSRANAAHSWKIDITYNPMTREEFSPIYSFLLARHGRLKPFYVQLPQHATSQTTGFTKVLQTFNGSDSDGTYSGYAAGKTWFTVDNPVYDSATDGYVLPGDMFWISDTTNTNHTKAYKITRVETNADYNSNVGSQPATNHLRLHFTPQLQKFTANNSTIIYNDPKIKVIMTDLISYQLKTDNLYVFNLTLEEVQ